VPVLAAAGLLVLAWATEAGPARIIGTPHAGFPPSRPPPTVTTSTPPTGQSLSHLRQAFHGPHHLGWVGDLLAWSMLLVLVLGVVAVLLWLWRNRWHRPEPPLDVTVDVLPTVGVTEALEQGADARLAAIAGGSPRNGIVACWLLVEEAIAEAGLPRLPWETSTEFTVRVLHRLDIDPRSIGTLSRLYREARFSEHPMGEDARDVARAALGQLDEELRAMGASARGTPA
jgi:hypothetical protein